MKKSAFDIHDYITESLIKGTLERLGEAQLTTTSHNFKDYGDIRIIDAATDSYKKYHDQAKNLPAIALIEVVLAANRNYNLHVLPNINRLKKDFPQLITFDDLNILIKNHVPEEFYKIWGPRDAKKYQTLKNILFSVEVYKTSRPDLSDFEIMNSWAGKVDIERYTIDDIGKHKNIAIATIQHLRMVLELIQLSLI